MAIGLIAAAVPGAGAALAQNNKDYGPLKPEGDFPAADRFWTKIDKDGVTAWRRAAEQELQRRGFSDGQIKKFVRLQLSARDKTGFGDYTRGREGIVKLSYDKLAIQFNTETGARMPIDPIAYARALPDCYAADEKNCSFKYSAQWASNADTNKPCLLPKRTVNFCKSAGFVNAMAKGSIAAARGLFAPACGERSRTNGCGADQLVFDDGKEQTKLAFDIAKLAGSTASAPDAEASQPARIVYHGDRSAAFKSREGPAELEEWEYDVKAYLAHQKRVERENFSEKAVAEGKRLFAKPLQYCWPHDVFQPCDLE